MQKFLFEKQIHYFYSDETVTFIDQLTNLKYEMLLAIHGRTSEVFSEYSL